MKLLEIIPTTKKNTEVTDFLMNYGDKFLGKDMVLCKDTPAFIANRIGVANIMSLFHIGLAGFARQYFEYLLKDSKKV